MENADEPFCPVVKALSNHLIVHEIFKCLLHDDQLPVSTRLVCRLWDEIFTSMQTLNLRLRVEPTWEYDNLCNATPFLVMCINMNPRLAKSVILNQDEFTQWKNEMVFTSTMVSFFDKFGGNVQHLEVRMEASLTPLLHQMLSTFCPNLKTMIFDTISEVQAEDAPLENAILPALPPFTHLVEFAVKAEYGAVPIKFQTLAQLVINSATRLTKFETVPSFYPDLSTVEHLKSLKIYASLKQFVRKVSASDFQQLTRMLTQVSGTVESVFVEGMYTSLGEPPVEVKTSKLNRAKELAAANFKMPPMPKLTRLENDFTEVLSFGYALEDIGSDVMPNLATLWLSKEHFKSQSVDGILQTMALNGPFVPFRNLKQLTIANLHQSELLRVISVKHFPALEKLKITRQLELAPMSLLNIISACAPLQLKHLQLHYLRFPPTLGDLWECFSSNLALFKTLQTLEIKWGNYESDTAMEDDLDGDDLIMVKEVLKEMTGMESVEIQNVKLHGKTAQEIVTFIVENEIPVKFI